MLGKTGLAVSKFLNDFSSFRPDPEAMDIRLHRRMGREEFLGLALSCAAVGIFIWFYTIKAWDPVDFKIFLEGRSAPGFYYGFWILPVFDLLRLLPMPIAYALWCLVNITGCFFAARVFGGRSFLLLASYPLISLLYYGQMGGILVGGLALCWWGIAHQRWNAAGLGLLLALTKYHVGLPFGLLLIWFSGISWRQFARLLIVPAVIGIITLIFYPLWPLEILNKISGFPYIDLALTLWIYLGAWALLFWLPAIFLPLSRPARFLALISLSIFAVPYFLQFDLVSFFALPIGWLPVLGYVGFLFPWLDKLAVRLMVVIPIFCYLTAVLPAAWQVWLRRKDWLGVSRGSVVK
jgi:hypothetical protein